MDFLSGGCQPPFIIFLFLKVLGIINGGGLVKRRFRVIIGPLVVVIMILRVGVIRLIL